MRAETKQPNTIKTCKCESLKSLNTTAEVNRINLKQPLCFILYSSVKKVRKEESSALNLFLQPLPPLTLIMHHSCMFWTLICFSRVKNHQNQGKTYWWHTENVKYHRAAVLSPETKTTFISQWKQNNIFTLSCSLRVRLPHWETQMGCRWTVQTEMWLCGGFLGFSRV